MCVKMMLSQPTKSLSVKQIKPKASRNFPLDSNHCNYCQCHFAIFEHNSFVLFFFLGLLFQSLNHFIQQHHITIKDVTSQETVSKFNAIVLHR